MNDSGRKQFHGSQLSLEADREWNRRRASIRVELRVKGHRLVHRRDGVAPSEASHGPESGQLLLVLPKVAEDDLVGCACLPEAAAKQTIIEDKVD